MGSERENEKMVKKNRASGLEVVVMKIFSTLQWKRT